MHLYPGDGPVPAKVMLVGEAFGQTEAATGAPFQGASGQELNRMLHDAGIMRSECFVTNLVNAQPLYNNLGAWIAEKKKDIKPSYVNIRGVWVDPIIKAGFNALLRDIAAVQPDVICAAGNYAMWALTGLLGITKWRGSQLYMDVPAELWPVDLITPGWTPPRIKLIPTLHPAFVLRDMTQRAIVVNDLKRVARERGSKTYSNLPNWEFIVKPNIDTVLGVLGELLRRLDAGELEWIDFDLETKAFHIETVGLSWSRDEAICIPIMCRSDSSGYWLASEEAAIVWRLYRVMTHPRVKIRGQNLLYDCQYTYRYWHFVPRVAQDTMISHHSAWCGLPKSLAYQASMYCDHYVYWKDDGKVADEKVPEERRWKYNCEDCVRTREVGEVSAQTLDKLGLTEVDAFQQKFFWAVLQCMQRGVRIDKKLRSTMQVELMNEIAEREAFFHRVLGHSLNPKSPLQMSKLFYEDLKQPANYTRAKKGVPGHLTCDDEALRKIALREPILAPLIRRIAEYRSLGVFLATFVNAPLDVDGRMRTSYNICGTETFRFSSSENAFGSGTNLQNVPKGGEDDDSGLVLPNVRKLFIPDDGFEMFDQDLSKADLRIVTWEADEPEMKAMLREGKDPYIEIAREFYKDPTITKLKSDGSENPKYRTFKSFAHGTHYLGTPHGLSARLGLTVHEAERAQAWYLGRMRRIKAWQKDFCERVSARRYVQNIFGYRRYYFGRIDEATFREAIAWVPQSTVALYINRIWMDLHERHPMIWVLLQVHDSLVGQYPIHRRDEAHRQLDEASRIVLPYDDPLIIPSGRKTSTVSWGDC
jgi:DNA polymerase I-like protein with 3'-5' exonuclease and polymerase domains/uracil-DNA glycosylase